MVYQQEQAIHQKPDTKKRPMADDILQEKLFRLLCSIRQADQTAFADFYELTVNRIFGLVYRILGNHSDSEEVVCEVFTQIWQQSDKYCPSRGSVMGWSLLIARSRALDLYRKRRTHDDIIWDAKEHLENFSEGGNEPDKIVQLFQESNETLTAIRRLSSVQRQLLSLAFFKGLTHSEISAALDMPLGSVKSHIRRAIVALQSIINIEQ